MRIAIIIPCLNEEAAIGSVVGECRKFLPAAEIYVLDNGSVDNTVSVAIEAGATVIHSPLRGKGNVIRHAFRVLDADYFLMLDGDGTYPLSEAQRLLDVAQRYNYEMVMGARLKLSDSSAFRPMHYLGNIFFTGLVKLLFNFQVQDLLTGYRVFSRRFAREINLLSNEFEIETELTIRAMAENLAFCEVPISYGKRVAGGKSKLRTFRDGWKILTTIVRFLMYFRPGFFFGSMAVIAFGASGLLNTENGEFLRILGTIFCGLGFYLHWQLNMQRLRSRSMAPSISSQNEVSKAGEQNENAA